MARTLTVELVNQQGIAVWRITYPSGARRYRGANFRSLGEVVMEFLRCDGDTIVVLPAGFAYTYTQHAEVLR